MDKILILVALFGASFAGVIDQGPAVYQQAYAQGPGVYPGAYAQPAFAQAYVSAGPQAYSNQIPAAALRSVEQVGVKKTITPVVTKETTHHTHHEPAIAVGHVQGYTQSSHGEPQYAPVQYNTQYTTYSNPTVGVNGPVTFAGPAVGAGVDVGAAPVAAVPVAYTGYTGAPVAAAPVAFAGAPGNFAAAPVAFAPQQYAAPVIAKYTVAAPAFAAPIQQTYVAAPAVHSYEHVQPAYQAQGIVAHSNFNSYAQTLGFKK